jgi:hypothetical protein
LADRDARSLIGAGFLLHLFSEFLHIALDFCKIVVGSLLRRTKPCRIQEVMKPDGFITGLGLLALTRHGRFRSGTDDSPL